MGQRTVFEIVARISCVRSVLTSLLLALHLLLPLTLPPSDHLSSHCQRSLLASHISLLHLSTALHNRIAKTKTKSKSKEEKKHKTEIQCQFCGLLKIDSHLIYVVYLMQTLSTPH